VGITVEGSNTLTRGLIIFGQGLNKSHPYIFPIFESIQTDDIHKFRTNFNSMLYEISKNYLSLFCPAKCIYTGSQIEKRLDYTTLKFSILSNFIALLGGKIKSKQMLSGNMSDIVSNLYLSYSILWYHHHFLKDGHSQLKHQSVEHLLNEIDIRLNIVIKNYPIKPIRWLLYPLYNRINCSTLDDTNHLYKYIVNNEELNNIIKDDIYYKNTVLEKMESIKNMNIDSNEYRDLYQDIIGVGEYNIDDTLQK
jgi:hypothetical protein